MTVGDLSKHDYSYDRLQDLYLGKKIIPAMSRSQEIILEMKRKGYDKKEQNFLIRQEIFANTPKDRVLQEQVHRENKEHIKEPMKRLNLPDS